MTWRVLALALAGLLATGCGYHTAGRAALIPGGIKTISIPGFVNQTQTYRVEQRVTEAVVREFNTRTHYRVMHGDGSDADATLLGTILSTSSTPLAYDSRTGRAASALVTVSMKVSLTDAHGKVLYQNANYVFHEQYEVSNDLASFFEEDSPAMERLSRDFARSLVADILEGF